MTISKAIQIFISKGGKITLKKINGKLEMIGPAEFVCEGTWQKK